MFYGITKLKIHLRNREKEKMLLDIKHKKVLTLKAENVMYFMSKTSNGKSMFIAALQQLSIFSAHSSYLIHLNSSERGPRHIYTLNHITFGLLIYGIILKSFRKFLKTLEKVKLVPFRC